MLQVLLEFSPGNAAAAAGEPYASHTLCYLQTASERVDVPAIAVAGVDGHAILVLEH